MNIHEYQAKAVLREFGVPVPRGIAAFSVAEAVAAAKELGGPVWVVKAQIHAGGGGHARGGERGHRGWGVWGGEGAHAGRGRRAGGGAPSWLHAGDASDRAAGQGGTPALHRGTFEHR